MTARRRCERTAKPARMPPAGENVGEAATDPEAALAIQLLEGARCSGLRPTELAGLYRRIMRMKGWSTTKVAAALSVTQPSVTRALKLLELPQVVRHQVDQGLLSPAAAYEISQLERPQDQVEVADRAVAERLHRDDVRSLVRATRTGQGPAVATWRPLQFRAGPFLFTIAGPVEDEAALREAWLDILNRLGRITPLREAGLRILSRLKDSEVA